MQGMLPNEKPAMSAGQKLGAQLAGLLMGRSLVALFKHARTDRRGLVLSIVF